MRNLVIPLGVIVLCAACALNKLSIVKDIGRKMDEHATEEAERIIRENPKFADLAKTCFKVRIPDGSELVTRQVSVHGIAISSTYFSDASVELLEPLFTDQLVADGWQKTRAEEFMGHEIHEFKMEPYRISIQFGGIGRDASYSIWCEDSRTMR